MLASSGEITTPCPIPCHRRRTHASTSCRSPRLASFRKNGPRAPNEASLGGGFEHRLRNKADFRARGIRLPMLQRLERKKRLGELSPERRFIAAEPVDDVIVEIGQTQEADRDVPRRACRADQTDLRIHL